jgi:alkylhydroperoxidase family enzyme
METEAPTMARTSTSTTRIPKAELTGLRGYVIKRFSTKLFGEVAEPAEVMWHNQAVLKDTMAFGQKVQKWHELDHDLASFAHMAVAALVGCSWCLDLNYFLGANAGLDLTKASQVPRWRDADVDLFTPLERDVMAFAEAMSVTPPQVTDDLFERLRVRLGNAAMIELTALVAFANMTTRSNTAMGIESQEFSKACAVPLAKRTPEPVG